MSSSELQLAADAALTMLLGRRARPDDCAPMERLKCKVWLQESAKRLLSSSELQLAVDAALPQLLEQHLAERSALGQTSMPMSQVLMTKPHSTRWCLPPAVRQLLLVERRVACRQQQSSPQCTSALCACAAGRRPVLVVNHMLPVSSGTYRQCELLCRPACSLLIVLMTSSAVCRWQAPTGGTPGATCLTMRLPLRLSVRSLSWRALRMMQLLAAPLYATPSRWGRLTPRHDSGTGLGRLGKSDATSCMLSSQMLTENSSLAASPGSVESRALAHCRYITWVPCQQDRNLHKGTQVCCNVINLGII